MKDWSFSVRMIARAAAAFVLAVAVLCASAPSPAQAEDLETLLPYVIENHDRVRASKARLTAARNRAREALGAWYPTLGQTANAGHERQQNDNGSDSSTGFNEWDISLTQLLWDFGATNAAVDKARLQVEEARYNLIETRQSLILEAITAYLNVIRSHAALGFAKDSEENIRRQTGLEEALVELGSGFSTDVLQAKTQLAGAQARRAQSEGGLINALNRFQAVFGRKPDNLGDLESVPFPASFLPQTLVQATDIALESNPTLKNAILAADIAVEDVRKARAENFTPKIDAKAERKFKKNVGGTIGSEQETLAKVEMTFDFNLGFTAINTLRASESDLSATTFTAADTRRNIEEQVQNSWQQLETAKQTASHLNNQANIAAAFLELARNERQLGRRSLIDVLSGETNLINSKSDAFSAETDVLIAAYGLLAATGQLEYDVIKLSKGTEAPKEQLPPSAPAAETPAPAPVLPVTPATGQINGEIEPDVTVADGRSVNDLHAMFLKIASPDVRQLPDTIYTFGRSQSGSMLAKPKHPPEPLSRYDSFAEFKTEAGAFADPVVPEDVEFASGDIESLLALEGAQTLPSDSDTGIASTPETLMYEDFTVPADNQGQANVAVAEKPSSAEITPIQSAATEIADTSPMAQSGADPFKSAGAFFKDLFSFMDNAPQADISEAAPAQPTKRYKSVSMDMPSMPIPEPDTVIEISKAPEPATGNVAATGNDPISTFFGNVVTFFENAKLTGDTPQNDFHELADLRDVSDVEVLPAENREIPKTKGEPDNTNANEPVEAASVPLASDTEVAPSQVTEKRESKGFGSLMDIFNFLEAAHQRALDEKAGNSVKTEKTEELAVLSPEATPDTERKPKKESAPQKAERNKPSLLALFEDLLGSGGKMLKDIEFEPGTPQGPELSDR
ncbi:MAG: TolC family protein [Rhodospirillales bacterium]